MSVVHQAQVEVILGKMSQISPFLSFVSEVLLGSRLASTKVGVGHNTSLWCSKEPTLSSITVSYTHLTLPTIYSV